jgi:hypothetical protein
MLHPRNQPNESSDHARADVRVEQILTLEFVTKWENTILVPVQGLGKIMLAKNLVHLAALAGQPARFINASIADSAPGQENDSTRVDSCAPQQGRGLVPASTTKAGA